LPHTAAGPATIDYRRGVDLPWKPGRPGEHVPARDLRASDADRERVVELLAAAHADGRLTTEEHSDRVGSAYGARTLGELSGLTADLISAEDQPIQLDSRPVYAVFGSARRGGRWVVPARFGVSALFGTVEIDLREAMLRRKHVVIDATMVVGSLRLLVPEGVRVEFTGRALVGSRGPRNVSRGPRSASRGLRNISRSPRNRQDPAPDAPVVEVIGTLLLASVNAWTPKRRWRDRLPGR
jgi:Domain of unknown function (DUF1707)/Cell wall-active antibiotics response 4TMS YvqF